MLERVLEPEIMDDPSEASAYDAMDHREVNRRFVVEMLSAGTIDNREFAVVLDLGCGTAQIPVELCSQHPDCYIVASDAAISMLEIGRVNVAHAGLEQRIRLHHGDCKQLEFVDGAFDVAISNSLFHHLAEPQMALKEMLRVLKPDGALFVRDLMRPGSRADVERMVRVYAERESGQCQQLFRQSLLAALSLEEAQELASDVGIPSDRVVATSDRHWTLSVQPALH